MQWQKGWNLVSLLGVMLVCTASMPPLLSVAEAQIQPSDSAATCTEQPGEPLQFLVRNLTYRSGVSASSEQFAWAVRSLERALQGVASVEEPFAKTDLVATIAGESGGQPSTLEQIIDHALATQQHDLPLSLLPQIVAATQTLEGDYGVINSKRAILVRLAHYYTVLGQPNQARSLLDQARQLLPSLQGDGFGLIASPIAKGYAALGDDSLGDKNTAIAILDHALQQTEAMTTNDQDYLAAIRQAIAIAYSHASAYQQALQVSRQIEIASIQASTLTSIAQHLAQTSDQSGDTNRVDAILTEALAKIQTLPVASRSEVLSEVGLVYAQIQQWETARQLINTIPSLETKALTLGRLAALSDRANRPAAVADDLNTMVAIAQTLEPFYAGDSLLSEVFAEYLANQQYALAFQLSQKLDETLQATLLFRLIEQASRAGDFAIARQAAEGIQPGWENQTRSMAWWAIAAGYAQARQFDQAIQLLPQITGNSTYPSHVLARLAIAQAYREAGQPDLASEQLNQAWQLSNPLDDSSSKLELLSLIAVQFTQLQQVEQAREVQTQVLNSSRSFSNSASYGIERLVMKYLQIEDYDMALRLVQDLEANNFRDQLYLQILRQLLTLGDLDVAWQNASNFYDTHQKVAFWVEISDHYRGLGQTETALDILNQALAIAQNIAGPDSRVFLSDAAQLDPSIPIWGDFSRGSLLESIAIRYAELGQDAAALQAVQALHLPENRENLLKRLACLRANT